LSYYYGELVDNFLFQKIQPGFALSGMFQRGTF
jgi:hypothetical protein